MAKLNFVPRFFYYYYILFTTTTNFLRFFSLVFPAFYFMACKCSPAPASAHKHQKNLSTKIFATVRQKNGRKVVILPLMRKFFLYYMFLETQMGCCLTKNFGTLRQILFLKNSDIPVSHCFLIPVTFRNSKTASSQYFIEDKKFLISFPDNPLMVHQTFRI